MGVIYSQEHQVVCTYLLTMESVGNFQVMGCQVQVSVLWQFVITKFLPGLLEEYSYLQIMGAIGQSQIMVYNTPLN